MPNRLFWTTYRGMAVLGFGGLGVGCAIATAMLVFRRAVEPFMPLAFSLLNALLMRHSHGGVHYGSEFYLWVVGFFYFAAVSCLVVMTYAAYRKPEQDRRVDAYLRREMQIDKSVIEPLPRARSRDAKRD